MVARGDKVKLRLLNPSSATIYDLMLAGHALTITHMDGRQVKPLETDVLRIGMGERYDVEFVADNPGIWLLAAADKGSHFFNCSGSRFTRLAFMGNSVTGRLRVFL